CLHAGMRRFRKARDGWHATSLHRGVAYIGPAPLALSGVVPPHHRRSGTGSGLISIYYQTYRVLSNARAASISLKGVFWASALSISLRAPCLSPDLCRATPR